MQKPAKNHSLYRFLRRTEKNPFPEDEQRIEFLESSGQCKQRAQRAKKNKGTTGATETRVNAHGEFKEDSIASHRIRDTRTREDHNMMCCDRRDGYGYRQPNSAVGGPRTTAPRLTRRAENAPLARRL